MKEDKKQNPKQEGWIVQIPKQRKKIKLDKKDRIILQALTENARTTLKTLSKMTLLSKNSVQNRMKNYEKSGLTHGFSTFINIHKLGFEMYQIGIKTKMTLAQKKNLLNT